MKFRTTNRFQFRNFIPLLLLPAIAFLIVENNLTQRIERGLERYRAQSPEKIYLHTDKPYYSAGETIWFKAYRVDAVRHLAGLPSQVIYVELLNKTGEVLIERNLKTNEGGAAGDILLPADLAQGTYQLRAYTNYMRNWDPAFFYHKTIPVFNIGVENKQYKSITGDGPKPGQSDYDRAIFAGFYPEGGDLVAGLRSKVGIKTVDRSGRGVTLQGHVVNLWGDTITHFHTRKRGFGLLSLTPEKGQLYTALVNYQGRSYRFQLPAPTTEGYTLSASLKPDEGLLKIDLEASAGQTVSDLMMVAHTRGMAVTFLQPPLEARRSFTGLMPLDSFPGGVTHLTLFDKSGHPVAERLIFVNHPERAAHLEIGTDKISYRAREEVELKLRLHDLSGKELTGNLSVSVTDSSSVEQHPHSENINTYLLLNADLPGRIDRPGYFFEDPGDVRRMMELDMLLLTQGWRRFNWKSLLQDTSPTLEFQKEEALTLKGQVTNVYGNPVGTCLVWITAQREDSIINTRFRTDQEGYFILPELDYTGSTHFLVQARKPRKRILKNEVIPDEPVGSANVGITFGTPHRPPVSNSSRPAAAPPAAILDDFLKKSIRRRQVERAFDGLRVFLDEIEVSAPYSGASPFIQAGHPYFLKSAPDSLLRQIAPVSAPDLLQNTGPFDQILLRPTPEPVFTWNGRQVQFQDDGITLDLGGGSRNNLRFTKLRNIIRPSNSSISTLYSGLNTGKAWYSPEKIDRENQVFVSYGLLDYTHPGYYQAREFYAPTYDQPLPAEQRPDVRTTIHWEPDLKTNAEGKAKLSFYTADNTGTYDIIVQGITKDGRPVTGRQVVVVE